MVALKLPITYISNEDKERVLEYIRQGTYLFRAMFNNMNKGLKTDFNTFNHYNHINLLDSWMRQSIFYDAKAIVDKDNLNKSVCFGGKRNFNLNKYDKIEKDVYKFNRLHPLCIIGEKMSGTKCVYSNRKFKILDDLSGVTFKSIDKNLITMLFPKNIKKNYKDILISMYQHQCVGDVPLTYRISADGYLSISYDETVICDVREHAYIDDLIFSIDMNPNHIGWSVVKWINSNTYEITASGVIELKELNDYENQLIKEKYLNISEERLYVTNKRDSDLHDIAISLVNKAIQYKCESFAIESLNIKSSDKNKGKYYNRLCNSQWKRNDLVNSIHKHCNLNNIRFVEVNCKYSSFWGNMLFRKHNLPDMCLASIEIGRRCFEYTHQYIKKDFKTRKCIVTPDFDDYKNEFQYTLSDLKLDIDCSKKSYDKFYEYIKSNKISFRVPIDNFNNVIRNDVDFSKYIKEIFFII